MGVSAVAYNSPFESMSEDKWINSRQWDLVFISLSVVLVTVPYLAWLFLRDVLHVEADAGRQAVNLMIAVVIGGPHMYATFTRTALDKGFRAKYGGFVRSSIIIPLLVITLALTNLTLLLTIFFFWASVHVLHQIIYVVESYNEKAKSAPEKTSLSPISKMIDFAVVLTALYPIAAYRIAISQDFTIGPSKLNDIVPSFFEQPWVFYLASAVFAVSLMAFIVKSIYEYRIGHANLPKIIFITFTVGASFIVPSLGNLDTAFQGMNVWHSFQYLALTWFVNQLRQHRGELGDQPLLEKISEDGKSRLFYGFNVLLTFGSGLIIAVVFVVLYFLIGGKWAEPSFAFETAYYIGVLSFLWIHYYHDHFLFTQTDSVLP